MSTDATPPGEPPKKKGKRARKQEAREQLLKDLRSDGSISSVEYDIVASKIGMEPDPLPAPVASPSPAVHPLITSGRRPGDKVPLSDAEKTSILEYLESGFNRAAACLEARILHARFRRQLLEDAEFADAVAVVENSRIGRCSALLYADAIDGNISSIATYIRNEENRAARLHGQVMSKKEFRLREKVINAQLNFVSSQETPIDMSVIPKSEWDEYMRLCDAIAAGADLTPDEYAAYGKYQAMIIRANNTPKPPPASLVNEALSLPLTGMDQVKKET